MPKTAKDVTVSTEILKTFCLGDYGTGKSVFASTFPTPGFIFDFDKGILVYKGLDFDYEQFDMSPTGWVMTEKVVRGLVKHFKDGKATYKTVIVDSTTNMTDIAMERALQLDPRRGDEGGPIWNVHYQMVKNLMDANLKMLLNLPCNIVFIGHWRIKEDSKTGAIIKIDPLLTGQLSTKLPGYFDEVYAFDTRQREKKTEYFFRTVPKGLYKARSRLSGIERLLPDIIPNNYQALMKHLNKKGGKNGTENKN